jgi:hypothetical protein
MPKEACSSSSSDESLVCRSEKERDNISKIQTSSSAFLHQPAASRFQLLITACLGLRGERKEQGFRLYILVLLWTKVFFGLGASIESLNGMATLRKKRWIRSISCLGFLLLL